MITMINKCFRISATLSRELTHMIETEQLALKNKLKTQEAEMEGYLKELGYGA